MKGNFAWRSAERRPGPAAMGLLIRGPIRLFIELMLLFGSAFNTDPQYPWAAKILHLSDDQMERAEELWDNFLDYQENVSGPDEANTRKALEDLSLLARQPVMFSVDDFVAGMLQEMTRVFRRKRPT